VTAKCVGCRAAEIAEQLAPVSLTAHHEDCFSIQPIILSPPGFAAPQAHSGLTVPVQPGAKRGARPVHEPQQLDLHGTATDASIYDPATLTGSPRPLGYTLFLALFPEPTDALRIHAAATPIISAHPMRDARQSADRLHVTLCNVYQHPGGVPCAVLAAACAAAARVSCSSLPLRLDRAESFSQDSAYVLRGDNATDAAVARLRRPLVAALRRFGLKPAESRTPHMSLVYRCGHKVPKHGIEPLAWTALRYVLVLSHVGLTRHEWLAAWDLPQR